MPLEKFVDPLPLPRVLQPKRRKGGVTYYEVAMRPTLHKAHRDLPLTLVWGYEGLYPGPTFEVRSGEHVRVKWKNELPVYRHLLPVDTTIHGAEPPNPAVRTVVHLHGANVAPDSDGHPEAWFTNGFRQAGPFFSTRVYDYPNIQPATALWYHDHALGITRLNVYAGLAGFYLIRDNIEDELNIPKGRFEIPLLIQDRSFNPDGSLAYPSGPDSGAGAVDGLPFPSIVPEFFGDTILVNGKAWPYLEVEPRKYRFRVLNGSNSRFYRTQLKLSDGRTVPVYQIGTDGGFIEQPVLLNEMILGPAERLDIIVDFSPYKGQTILMTNDAPTPFMPGGTEVMFPETREIMQFRVTLPLSGKDTTVIPDRITSIEWLTEEDAVRTRNLALVERTDQFGRLMLLLTDRRWSDPISEKPILDTVEIWGFVNTTPDTHPIHLHLVRFQVLDRQPFDVAEFERTGRVIYTGERSEPEVTERGWKDTVRANPGEVTRIIARFGDFAGVYPWHCHILEHEDHEMMRPYEVLKPHIKSSRRIVEVD